MNYEDDDNERGTFWSSSLCSSLVCLTLTLLLTFSLLAAAALDQLNLQMEMYKNLCALELCFIARALKMRAMRYSEMREKSFNSVFKLSSFVDDDKERADGRGWEQHKKSVLRFSSVKCGHTILWMAWNALAMNVYVDSLCYAMLDRVVDKHNIFFLCQSEKTVLVCCMRLCHSSYHSNLICV